MSSIPIAISNTAQGLSSLTPSSDPSPTNATSSATSAASTTDSIIKDVFASLIPLQGDMSQMIQNRPQVMLPKPTLPGPATAGDPNRGKVAATTSYGQKRNDLMDLFHTVGQVATQAVNLKRQKDENELMSDLAIIQAAASNPDDPHNKAILDKMAADPKVTKRLQKALGYNPLSGEQPPAETKTLMKFGAQTEQKKRAQALVQAAQQRTGGAMEALQSRAPNVPQMNPIIAVQGELIKAGILPKTETSMKSFVDLTKEIMTNDTKYAEIRAKAETSRNTALLNYLKAVDEGKNKLEVERMKQQGAGDRANVHASATVKSAELRSKATVDAAKIRGQSTIDRYKSTHTSEEAKALDKAIKNIDADIKNLDVQIATARSMKDDNKVKSLTEEQASKKAIKDALEQKEVGGPKSATDLLRGESGSTNQDDEIDEEDRIF